MTNQWYLLINFENALLLSLLGCFFSLSKCISYVENRLKWPLSLVNI